MQHLWNAGHVAYFALLAYLLLSVKRIARLSQAMRWVMVLSLTLLFGVLIEVSQIGTRRTPDVLDILRDMTGSLLVLAFHASSPSWKTLQWGLRGLRVLLVIILLIMLKPLMISLLDESIAKVQFPVLADFSTPFEMNRWEGDAARSRLRLTALNERNAMLVKLTSRRYSGVHLKYFPGDWRDYRMLILTLYNPQPKAMRVTCRIHDARHVEGVQRYSDRFNQTYTIQPGLSSIEIDLEVVALAPRARRMDLAKIKGLGIFASSPDTPGAVYIQEVRLE
ncbi:MAG: VanZ family protein [Gammaproteobacteria bacterium]|nr:VanZ family protein [Gammaproteobacteria bacterium]